MKTKSLRPQLLLGLLVASIALVSAALYSTYSSNSAATVLNTSNSLTGLFDPPRTESGCTQWLVYQKTGPNIVFWNANGSVARTVSGTTMTSDLKLSVPAGKFIKYVAYGAAGNHALNVKLTDANNAQVGGWYIFSATKNKTPYRYDASVDSSTAVNVYFKGGHVFQQSNFLGVTYCPMQTQSSSSISSTGSVTAGNLFVTQSISPVRTHQLLGGKLEDWILLLTLRAESEDIDVTDLILSANGVHANRFSNSVKSLELFKAGSTTPFAIADVGGCGSIRVQANSMCANLDAQQLIVPRGLSVDILVRPRMKTDEEGSVSGQMLSLYVDPTATSWSGSGAVRARGVQSRNALLKNDGDTLTEGEVFIGTNVAGGNRPIQGNVHQIVHSKVLSLVNANPDVNGSTIPTEPRGIGQFKFSAATHANTKNGSNDWTLSGILFNVNATNVTVGTGDQRSLASDFFFYNKANSTVRQQCFANVKNASGSFVVSCGNLPNSGVNTRIDAGTDATFVLEADVENPKIASTNSTLQVSLTSFSTPFASSFGAATSHLEWHDQDAGTSTKFFWMDYPETFVSSTLYQS